MTLFIRKARLIVGDFDVTNLRFAFTIEKHLRKEPNTGKISIWNLTETQRQSLENRKKGIPVQVEAGYRDQTFLIFKGFLDIALSEKDGPDWITNIYTDDGKDAIKARGAVSYRGGVNVNKILQDTAKQMGVGLGNLVESIKDKSLSELGTAVANGFTGKNNPADTMFTLLDDLGFDGSIQDNEIQVMQKGQPINPNAVLLTENTGLVDTPAVDRKGRLEARVLMIPGLFPGASVSVKSPTANGNWRVDSTTYIGDTFTNDWYIEIEGAGI